MGEDAVYPLFISVLLQQSGHAVASGTTRTLRSATMDSHVRSRDIYRFAAKQERQGHAKPCVAA